MRSGSAGGIVSFPSAEATKTRLNLDCRQPHRIVTLPARECCLKPVLGGGRVLVYLVERPQHAVDPDGLLLGQTSEPAVACQQNAIFTSLGESQGCAIVES
jgi:hypothetical protein